MKAILCALDFSEASENVIKMALEVAAQKKTNLVVLYAYRLLQTESREIADFRNSMEEQAKADFDVLVKKLKINGDVPYEFRAEIGFLTDRIGVFLKKNLVDTIVMGQNLAFPQNEKVGVSFENILDTLKIPVLVVPSGYNANEV